ncbi:MAG: phenylalanine--tRNA ligase subunit beta, partial [Leadbetterella sp.]
MKISYKQLKTLVDFSQSPEDIGKLLTQTGLEVEGIEQVDTVKGGYRGLVVGEVTSCEKHPDADKLKLTKVDIGTGILLDIVCGAPNVAMGQKVVVATVGSELYPTEGDPFQIKKSKIRGALSEGMLCAEDEIGLGTSHDGIIVLDNNTKIGTTISDLYSAEPDYQIEIGLTPNRADAASHFGVARDIKAVTGLPISMLKAPYFRPSTTEGSIRVEVQDNDKCPRFCGLEIRNIQVKPSPDWLKKVLSTIGVNSINNIVDISNYICHMLGQPMHIFDASAIQGSVIKVRVPKPSEKLITLDGVERKFTGQELAICNDQEPMALAGVFGGKNSGVTDTTKDVFLEVAYFEPAAIRKSSMIHGLKTDASFRYERGTDPNMPPIAIQVAASMIIELAGGEICKNTIDIYPQKIENKQILLKFRHIQRLIGKDIGSDTIKRILESLDISILSEQADSLQVSIPPYRVDVTREADVIEEILRIYGFDNIEESDHLNTDFIASFPPKEPEMTVFNLADRLISLGFTEVQNLSIVRPKDNDWTDENVNRVQLLNPLSEELSEMRNSLLFSGLNNLQYNINRKSKDLRFFEFGRIYSQSSNEQG